MYVYLPVQFIFSFCSNYCLLTFCIFLNIFLDLLYILCHAVFLAIKTNKKKKKKLIPTFVKNLATYTQKYTQINIATKLKQTENFYFMSNGYLLFCKSTF